MKDFLASVSIGGENIDRKRTPIKPYTAAFQPSFQQHSRSETLVFPGDLSGKLSSPAVQQLWTLYPGKQTANLMTNTQTPPPATTVVIPTGAPATNTVANHAERPEKFNGQNFKRWQQKMFFYLTTLGLARFLKETAPQVEPPAEGQSSNAQAVQAVEAWKHSDFLCHNYVLNGLIDPLYNVYCKTTTAKELWESLERKYKTEDAGTKKFVVARFLDYKMVDSKNVISQVQDLQVLLHDIHAEGMTLSETFQVAAIIEKLPPSWVEFKNYLKHKRKEMSVEDLVVRLRIEEDNKLAQKDTYTPDSAKANMVEHAGSSSRFNSKGNKKDKRKNDKKGKGKSEYLAPKAGIVKQKFQGTCYNCDQPGHRAANCKMPKRANPRQANMRALCDKNVELDKSSLLPCYYLCKTVLPKGRNRTLKEMVTAMLISSGMSQDMWGEAILTATYLLNKIHRKEKGTEIFMNYGMEENIISNYLRVWGCLDKVVVPTPQGPQKIRPNMWIVYSLDM
ncbi:pol polyprotein [Tanacetum coccineum]